MHPASHKVLLVVWLVLSGTAQAAVPASPPQAPSGLFEAKNASSMNSPPTKPIVAKPASPPADMVRVAAPSGSPGADVQPSLPAITRTPEPAPSSSPWRAWQPPLAAAVLMLVIALKRQGGNS